MARSLSAGWVSQAGSMRGGEVVSALEMETVPLLRGVMMAVAIEA